jgi:hypothetical protein
MVLVLVGQEAGPVGQWPRTPKSELGNNSKQPRDVTEKRQSDSLKEDQAYSFFWVVEEGRC